MTPFKPLKIATLPLLGIAFLFPNLARAEKNPSEFWMGLEASTLGFPSLYSAGLSFFLTDMFSMGLTWGGWPSTELPLNRVKSTKNWDNVRVKTQLHRGEMRLSLHPLSNAFFMGASMGRQQIQLEAKADWNLENSQVSSTIPVTFRGNMDYSFASISTGFLKKYESGLTWGMDIGWQFAITDARGEMDVSGDSLSPELNSWAHQTQSYQDFKRKVEEGATHLLHLPTLNLCRLGWVF